MKEISAQILKSCEIYLKCVCSVKRKDCRREIYIALCERGLRRVAVAHYLICLKQVRILEAKMLEFGMRS